MDEEAVTTVTLPFLLRGRWGHEYSYSFTFYMCESLCATGEKHIIYNFILFYVIFFENFPKYLRDLLKKVTYIE